MEPESLLPPSLLNSMGKDESIVEYRAWRHTDNDFLDGTLSIEAHYDKQRARFSRSLENTQLRNAIHKYKCLQNGNTFWEEFDPDTCTWHQVFDQVQEAEKQYEEKGERNPVRRAFRVGDALSRNLGPMLEGIPDSDGLGLIKGGMILILNAIQRRSQAAHKIYESFHDLPEIVAQANLDWNLFPHDKTLHILTYNLYQAIFDCVPQLLDILLRRSEEPAYKRFGKAVFGDDVARVEEVIRPLTAAARTLTQFAGRLQARRDAETAIGMRESRAELSAVRQNQFRQHEGIVLGLGSLHRSVNTLDSKMEAFGASTDQLHSTLNEVREVGFGVMNALYVLLQEQLRRDERCQEMIRMQQDTQGDFTLPDRTGDQHDVYKMPLESMATHLHIEDLDAALSKEFAFRHKDLARAAYAATTEEFQRWLTCRGSDMLLIHGHCEGQVVERFSTMSVFAATLVRSIQDQPQLQGSLGHNLVLFFFCGPHSDQNDPFSGPDAMMRSLIAQLLNSWPVRKAPQFLQPTVDGLDVQMLCDIFASLVKQLSPNIRLYCIIDSVSDLETSLGGWQAQMGAVSACFRNIVGGNHTAPQDSASVKILLISTESADVVSNFVPSNRQVDLIAGHLHGQSLSTQMLTGELQAAAPPLLQDASDA